MLRLTQQDSIAPVCPHCSKGLQELWFSEIRSNLGKRYIYFCNHCHKVLGVSHRKGFWMG